MLYAPTYHLDFVLNTSHATDKSLHASLIEYGEGLEIVSVFLDDAHKGKNFKIQIRTQDPTIIFDICSQFGKLKLVKIHEEGGR
jgi:hypothetical protein